MKLILLIIATVLASASGFAQQLHFAYLQTDTHQPFYVTLNQKNYSSSSAGYIILPKLQNGDYPLRVGFAKNADTEQEFLLQVKDNDQGFLIKNFGDKGWGLFNLQTMAVQYAGVAAQERAKLAAAQKAEADQRQRKLDEELQAAATQRRNDSLKTAAIAQQAYTDSMAAVAVTTRQKAYQDSVLLANNTALQARYADSVTNAKALNSEAERQEKIANAAMALEKKKAEATAADEKKKADAAAVSEKKKVEATAADEKKQAAANEAERIKETKDATAREQAAIAKQQKEEKAADAKAKVAARENERLEKTADATAKVQAASLEKQRAATAAAEAKAVAKENERLEKIADSSARAQTAALEKQTVKEEAVAAKKAKAATAITPPDNISTRNIDVAKAVPPPVMIQQTFTDSGWHYAYNVTNNNQREKVDVFIPSAQPKQPGNPAMVEEKAATPPTEAKEITPVAAEKKDSVKFLDINVGFDTAAAPTVQMPKDTVPSIRNADTIAPIIAGSTGNQTAIADTTPVAIDKSILNANCKAVANEKDFLTARRKIASVFGTEAMLAAARKLLKDKCYTTEQLRNLCVLFLTDEGRYQFLDAAYPYAFDAYRYSTLQDLLIDTYYLQRFKTMLH